MSSQMYPTGVILRQLVSHHPTFVLEGVVLIDSRNSGEKNWKNKLFLLTLVQQLQPTEILHCSKLLQNITIKTLCDVSSYTWKILQSIDHFGCHHHCRVVRSCFIYELVTSTKLAFLGLQNSRCKYSPMPSEFQFKGPPCPRNSS